MDSSRDNELMTVLSKVLLIDKSKISDEMSRKSVTEWDSMAHLMLVSELESAFDIIIDDDDIVEIQTVADIKKILRKLGIVI